MIRIINMAMERVNDNIVRKIVTQAKGPDYKDIRFVPTSFTYEDQNLNAMDSRYNYPTFNMWNDIRASSRYMTERDDVDN